MKRVFKISNPKHLPPQADVDTDNVNLNQVINWDGIPIIVTIQANGSSEEWNADIEKLIIKIAAQLFPGSHGSWTLTKQAIEEICFTDDNPTIKDNDGSLNSFPSPTDDITDSSAT